MFTLPLICTINKVGSRRRGNRWILANTNFEVMWNTEEDGCLCFFYDYISVQLVIILIKMLMLCKGLQNFSFVCLFEVTYVIVSRAWVTCCSGLFLGSDSTFSETEEMSSI